MLFLKSLLFALRSTIGHIQLGCIDKNILAGGQVILYLVNDSYCFTCFFKVIIWKLITTKWSFEVFSD